MRWSIKSTCKECGGPGCPASKSKCKECGGAGGVQPGPAHQKQVQGVRGGQTSQCLTGRKSSENLHAARVEMLDNADVDVYDIDTDIDTSVIYMDRVP